MKSTNRLFTLIFGVFFLGFLVVFASLILRTMDGSSMQDTPATVRAGDNPSPQDASSQGENGTSPGMGILVLAAVVLMGIIFIRFVLIPAFFKKKSPAWTGME